VYILCNVLGQGDKKTNGTDNELVSDRKEFPLNKSPVLSKIASRNPSVKECRVYVLHLVCLFFLFLYF
jgi:hypothetical protein